MSGSVGRMRDLAPGAIACLGVAALVAAGAAPLSLIDLVLVLGVAVILPLSLGGDAVWWLLAASSAVVALLLPAGGGAASAIVPLMAVTGGALVDRIRTAGPPRRWTVADAVAVTAAGYASVAAGALLLSRAGIAVFGTQEPIVELAAVHFVFAGPAALVLAAGTLGDPAAAARPRTGRLAVAFTAGAPPVVATGFLTGAVLPQVGGAVLMTLGVWFTASLEVRRALGGPWSPATVLLAVSGMAAWVPMVLAVAWAAGQHWPVPALSIPDMARTHGLVNAFAFVLCGLVARRLGLPPAPGSLTCVPA